MSSRAWAVSFLLTFLSLLASASAALNVQTFFIPFPETDFQSSLKAIDTTGTPVGNSMKTIISIVVPTAGTVIRYDHWEDGYEADLNAPVQPGTQVWGDGNLANGVAPGYPTDILPAGAVITLNNNVALPRSATTLAYDGRDRIGTTAAVAVTRAGWGIAPGTVLASATEVYDTRKYGTAYKIPVGTTSGTAQNFEYSSLHIIAAQDNTTVQVDLDGNGTVDQTKVLNLGDSMFVNGGVKAGATVTSTKPVQVHELTGDIGSTYEGRTLAIRPTNLWGSSYYAPVGTTLATEVHTVYFYNPGAAAITVNYETSTGTGTISVPAYPAVGYDNAKFSMPMNSGAHFYTATGDPFYAIGANDSGAAATANQTHDWGYALVPENYLTTGLVIGFGPGSDDLVAPTGPDQNGNPVWVTPNADTTVYVNYAGDFTIGALTAPNGAKYDIAYPVKKLASQTIYDPNDKDMTKARLFTTNGVKLAGAWGEDPSKAGPGSPYLDMGTTIVPFPQPAVTKTSAIVVDLNSDGKAGTGDTIEYLVRVANEGVVDLDNTIVLDALPTSVTYVPGSTKINGVSIPDNSLPSSVFPVDESGYVLSSIPPGSYTDVKYRVTVNAGATSIINNVTVNGGSVTLSTSTTVPVAPSGGSTACSLAFTNASGAAAPSYASGSGLYVTLTDADSAGKGAQSVVVKNTTTGDIETISLTETAPNSGIFRNTSPLPSSITAGLSQGDGTLYSPIGSLLQATHTDAAFGDVCTANSAIAVPSLTKKLYLNGAGGTLADGLDRIDPVAANDTSTSQTSALASSATTKASFTTSGANSWTVPAGVTSITVKSWGAGGGGGGGGSASAGGAGGGGGYATTTIAVTPGETLTVPVGGGGGGGAILTVGTLVGTGGGGGGWSGVKRGTTTLIAAAGGAGGGGGDDGATNAGGAGGAGGATTGVTGGTGGSPTAPGVGGTQSAGGSGGTTANSIGSNGSSLAGGTGASGYNTTGSLAGTVGVAGTGGGAAGGQANDTGRAGGGGGGGGYFGGGGASGATAGNISGGGGGSGSSYAPSGTLTAGSGQTTANNADTDYNGSAGQGGNGGAIGGDGTAGNIGRVVISYSAPGSATFTQSPTFASAFTLPATSAPSVTAYYAVSTGSMPASPSVTAVLKNGATTIATSSSVTASATTGSGFFTFSFPALASAFNFAVGDALSLVITNNQSGVTFTVSYDSITKPSVINLPTTTVITITSFGLYSTPYPGTSLITSMTNGQRVYARAAVSDPFGTYDITSLDLAITDPANATTTQNLTSAVSDNGTTKIYEYSFLAGPSDGAYTVKATANEGTEGINAIATVPLQVTSLDLGTPSTTTFIDAAGNDVTVYPTTGPVYVQVVDRDQNTNASVVETVTVVVTTSNGDRETITLTETGPNTGIFRSAAITTNTSAVTLGNGALNVIAGAGLSAVYIDPTDSSDTSSDTATIAAPVGTPAVNIFKSLVSPSNGNVLVGGTVTYNIAVSNPGTVNLPTVSVTDTYTAANLSFVSASIAPNTTGSGTMNWTNVGPLAPGQTVNITVNFTALLAGTNIPNSVSAGGTATAGPSTVNVTIQKPAILVTKTLLTPASGPAYIGDTISWRIVVQNVGNTSITTLPLSDTYSGGAFTFVSATTAPDSAGSGSLLWNNLGPLAAAASKTIDVTMTVKGTGNPSPNTADVSYAVDSLGNAVPPSVSTASIVTIGGSIGSTIFKDTNNNGAFNTGEGIANVYVYIDTNGNGIRDVGEPFDITDSTGTYSIHNLPVAAGAGTTYNVKVDTTTLPAGLTTNVVDPDATKNSATSITLTRTVPDVTTANWGYRGTASIGDRVWLDLNGDGIQDATDRPIAGVKVFIDLNGNGTWEANEPTATTDANGNYTIGTLPDGTYSVVIDTATLPAGVTPTFDLDGTATANKSTVTVTAGQVRTDADFGYVGGASIGSIIYADWNGNGVLDATTDKGLSGVKVFIDLNGDGIRQANEPFATTNATGAYNITGLTAGTYAVVVDTTSLPAGVVVKGDPDPTKDGKTSVTVTSSQANTTTNFGYQGSSIISGKFVVGNGNGVADTGEAGLNGVTLSLLFAGPDGIFGNGDDTTLTTNTAADGAYSFGNLLAGSYRISKTTPAGYASLADADGGNPDLINVTLAGGATLAARDFEASIVTVSGKVWDDANNSANNTFSNIPSAGETGTNAGGLLYAILVDSSGNVAKSTPVNADGSYTFSTVLPASGYTIRLATSAGTVGQTAPAAGLPSGWTATSPTATGAFTVATTSLAGNDFGIESLPTANPASGTFANPGGTTPVSVPTLSGTDLEDPAVTKFIIKTLPTNGTLYYNGTAVTTGQTITGYNAALLTFDPNDGTFTSTFTYTAVDAAGKESSPATVTMNFNALSIAGNALNDANGLTDSIVNGTGTNAGATLYANLVSGGLVVAKTPIAADGSYSFANVSANTTYTVVLSTTNGTIGAAAPAASLPAGYVNTGENIGAAAGNDGTPNGSLTVAIVTTSISNANFGIEQPPTANAITAASQANPGGTTEVTVATLTGTDPEDPTVTKFIIQTLPTNGTLYYNGSAVTVGQTITAYNPALLTIDPNNGSLTVSLTYSAVDAAGKVSAAATVQMPFAALSIAGNALNDANGLTDSIVNGTGTNVGATLYANLVSGGLVVAKTPIAADGSYSFANVSANTTYTVVLSTTNGTIGAAPPVASLPAGYVNTGENIGTAAGNDGTPNGSLTVAVVTTSITNANFGIEQPPTANAITAASQANPGGTTQVTVSTLTGTDPEDPAVTKFIIQTLPGNGTLYYNGSAVTVGQTITAYNPALLTIDPNNGSLTVSFTYSAVDAAGKVSAAATVQMPFTALSLSGTVFDDANGLTDSTVNGTGTNAGGTLYASLVSGGTVAQTVAVSNTGAYNFSNLSASTTYSVVLSTTNYAPGATAAAALPASYVNTGENIGISSGNDGSANGILAVTVTNSSVSNVNFGIERLPSAYAVSAASQINPGGTTKVTVPTLTWSDPEDQPATGTASTLTIKTLPTNGTLYYNGTAVTAGQAISSYNPSLLTLDPNDGSITSSFTYTAVDAAGRESSPATVSMPFTALVISGNVLDDANGLTDNIVNGTGTNATNQLFASLVSGGTVSQTVAVSNTGTYSFPNVSAGTTYSVVLSTTNYAPGATASAALPSGYVNTGENVGTGAGNDGSANGILAVSVTTSSVSNANFGIERLPTANTVTASSQINPGGMTHVTVTTLGGTDPEDSSVTTFIIKTLPANGTLYYNGSAVTAGQVITGYDSSLLTLDPNDGSISVSFTYTAVDAAGRESSAATMTMPFTAVSLSGNVFDDANGLIDSTVNGTGTNAGGTLYANLVSGGSVAQVVAVAANGSYSFGTVAPNTNYTIVLSSTQGTIGNPSPSEALPTGWVNTGENLGAGSGTDGTINGSLAVSIVTTSLTNANFGIERTPTANAVSAASQINPGGTTQVTVPALSGTDPEDASVTTFVIKTLPTNGTLYYNGSPVTLGQIITGYDPTKLTVDPASGVVTVSFTYSVRDTAGVESAPASVSMPFNNGGASITGQVFDDANGITDNTVNGTGTNAAGTLYVSLVNAGIVEQVVAVAGDGSYAFSTVQANTSYTLVLSTNPGTIGNPAPAVALPAGWVNIAEHLGAGIGTDGTVNGTLTVSVASTGISDANFAIERTPTALPVTGATQINPGGTALISVPTLNGSDPEDTMITTYVISLPTNGILYYDGTPVTVGQTIYNYNANLLKVDPDDGAVTVSFSYSATDAAGQISSPAMVTMPFTAIDITGTVFNDANGLTDSTVNGAGTNAGGVLYANLVSGGNVDKVVTVAANGSYTFGTVAPNTNYTIVLSTTQGTVGSAAPSAALPPGWVNIGENIGTTAGDDGTVNGSLAISVATATVTDANFGIERLPTANAVSGSLQFNPGGTTKVSVPALNGSDPEDVSITTYVINTLPAGGTLYYDGIPVTLGQVITSFDSSKLTVDPIDGAVTASFTYSSVDAAGRSSSTATVTMPFTAIGISGRIFDDANGLADSIVNGAGTNAGGALYANLITGGNVAQVVAIAANGTYNFGTVAPNTSYSVVLSTTQGTVGSAAPSAALPPGWVNTGENIGTSAGNDGVADGSLAISVTTTSVSDANFGIERLPAANNVSASSQANPGGTTRVTVPTLTWSDPEDQPSNGNVSILVVKTLPTNGTLYYNGSPVVINTPISSYNPALLTVDPNDGGITVTFTYAAVDAAGRESAPASVVMPFTALNITGNVLNDANGLTDSTVNGTGTDAGGPLYANLVSGDLVVAKTPIAADGSYSFANVSANTTYTVVLSTTNGTIGAAPPAASLPAGYVNIGENIGTAAGNDGTPNGSLTVAVTTASITQANFGIEQPPTADAITAASQANPGGSTTVTVPTLTGSDPEDTSVTKFRIQSLPSNGTLYYNGSAVTAGQTIPGYNPALLTVDPSDGSITVTFDYAAIDSAGVQSAPASVTLPFTDLSIAGNVFDDANGLTDSTVNGTGTNTGGPLYANLVSGGLVVKTAAINPDGTYVFTNVSANTTYAVVISTTSGTIGIAPPAASLPAGYVNTGENIGTAAGNDGTPNGTLTVAVVTTTITNANFGIEQPPTADAITAASQANPGGTTQVTVPTLTGTDPEDPTVTKFIIQTLPGNGTLYYNGSAVTVGQTITAYNPALLTIDPNSGSLTVSFTYSAVDAAGKVSAAATVQMPFAALSIAGNALNDANGLTDSIVNGTGTNAGATLYANLVSGGLVVAKTPIAADGSYSFANVSASTTYTVVLSTTEGTVSNAPPSATLPSGYVNTGENIGTAAGNDGVVNGALTVAVATTSITQVNFGIEQPPTADAITAASQANPGGTTQITVPTLTGSDPEDPSITTFVIKTLPTNGTLYYDGSPATIDQEITDPSLLTIDPNDGSITVAFTYSVVDTAGAESSPATVEMPFTGLSIAGNALDDANGLTDSIVNGTGTNVGATLYANLVSGGLVVAKTPIAADGSYSFANVSANTTYTVVLSTIEGSLGNAPPSASLPPGYVNTGENLGIVAGNDGTVNGILTVAVVTTSITQANFGIEQPPTADPLSAAVRPNLGGTVTYSVPALSGTDAEDTTSATFVIKTLPTNGTLYYNGTPVAANIPITSFNPALLTVDPDDGSITVSFTYAAIDAAGQSSPPAAVELPFVAGSFVISGQVRDDYDSDGQFEDNDNPVGGVTIRLYWDTNGNGQLDATEPLVATSVTNATGQYLFSGLADGNYIVVETDPLGATSTGDIVGDPTDNHIAVTISGASSTGNNFLDAVDPTGYIYNAATGKIVPGGTITVSGPAPANILMNGNSGQYSFLTDGTPGTYTISYTPPAGYIIDPTRPVAGPSFDPTGRTPDPYAIGSGENPANPGYLLDYTAATNTYYFTFVLAPGDPFVINNNIPLVQSKPTDWAGWQYKYALGGQNGPTQNPDGDLYDNLQEFAFCLVPNSGVKPRCPLEITVDPNGLINAVVTAVHGLFGTTVTLEYISDLALSSANGGGWTPVTTITPTVTSNGDGTDKLTYANLESIPALANGKGFVRLKVDLASPAITSRTYAAGWTDRTITGTCETYGNPFLECEVFSGTVDSNTVGSVDVTAAVGTSNFANALGVGKTYYVEVLSGSLAGHRWKVIGGSTATTIEIGSGTKALTTNALAGASVIVREAKTIGGLFPPALYQAGSTPNNSDKVLIYDANSVAKWSVYYLADMTAGNMGIHWVKQGDNTLANQDGLALDACQGIFIHHRAAAISTTQVGHVRQNAMACPLNAGQNLVGAGFPIDQSYADRAMTWTGTNFNGFVGGLDPVRADNVLFWKGDTTLNAENYTTYWLVNAGFDPYRRWSLQGDNALNSQDLSKVFKATRASFYKSTTGNPNYVVPTGWTP